MLRLLALGLPLLWICGTACKSVPMSPGAESQHMKVGSSGEADAGVEVAPVYKNTLKWSTASEVENFGFDIYRGESEEGPFVRLNDTPIPAAGTSDVPNYYEYVDETIDPYREHYYYIESISIHGERQKFTPTYRKAPKISREGEESGE